MSNLNRNTYCVFANKKDSHKTRPRNDNGYSRKNKVRKRANLSINIQRK